MVTGKKTLDDFLSMSEDEAFAELEGTSVPELRSNEPQPAVPQSGLEGNTRLTIIRMFEETPEMEQPFTFSVRKYCGPAYVQAMRTTLAKARKFARNEGHDLGEQFKMIVTENRTLADRDVVTVMRTPKGKKVSPTLSGLARLLSGSDVADD
jgi:hypothetical protein